MLKKIDNIDKKIINTIHQKSLPLFLKNTMKFFTHIGDTGLLWIGCVLTLFFYEEHRYNSYVIAFSLIIILLLGEGLFKNIIKRKRPYSEIEDINCAINKLDSYSFPSGHTASSFGFALTVGYIYPTLFLPLLIIAMLISISRVVLLVHYPSDIIGGFFLSVICSITSILIFL